MNVLKLLCYSKESKNKKSKIKAMLQTELNSTNSLVPRQRRHKYFDCSLLQLLFCSFISQGNFNRGLSESAPDRQVFKIKTDESEYRTQGTNVSLN